MKGRWIIYSADELAWLEANCTLSIKDYHGGFVARFGRSEVTEANVHSLRKRKDWSTGRTGQFSKGQEAHNKGKPCAPGKGGRHPNAQKTQFRKGERSGVAVALWKPIGTERIMDGYLQRKINDDMPERKRWKAVHLMNWEAVNGPVPKGYALKSLDGNRLNVEACNWIAIPRALLPRLNGGRAKKNVAYDGAPAELKPTLLAIAKLDHAVREAGKRERVSNPDELAA